MRFFKSGQDQKNYTDSELIQHYQKRFEGSFLAELFQRYSKHVFCYCLDFLKNEQDSQDAVMDIFVTLAEELKHRKVHNFISLLNVICRNYCLMKKRRMDFHKNTVSIDEANVVALVEKTALQPVHYEMEIEDSALEFALAKLNENQQLCVRLFYLEEKSYREVAGQTGLDVSQVRSHLQNGRRNLKKILLQAEIGSYAK